ncbi:nuclear GTP-binding protein nug1 [Entomophthora muscae]|uniref:Nuclear GTP-binding protein nug1 n=1 Tax=Entomophthora muscae TaxID=34485 RepID=A0ACC2SBG1_9FUNG|nr:nuclear GTP-binding protein nug1 [Entomophthora muscae]
MVQKKRHSKRVSTDRRAKNHKNAMEKARKARKESRLHPQSKKIKKDPGIPNLWPFKENLLKELQESKNKVINQSVAKRRPDKPLQSNPTLAQMAAEAKKPEEQKDVLSNDPALSGNKDNSRKAYFKEFKKVLDGADVLLEVLDARDPLGCRTRNIERLILNDPNKRVILVLNKIDLIPTDVADAWIKYLRKDFPTIGFKSSTQNQRTNIGQSKIHVKNADTDLLSKSSTVGADSLIKLLKNYSRSQNIKTSLTVGVIGYPNVGKSSLINSLKRSKVCGVGSRPGFTKVAQEIHLDAKLKLLDCPGIVFGGDSKSGAGDVLLRNCIKVELLDDPISAVDYLLNKTKWHYVMMHYELPAFSDVKGFLVELSRRRQLVKKNGILDLESTARMVLRDWNSGSIPYYTLPPKDPVAPSQNTQIISTWGQEFDLKEYDEAFIYDSQPDAFQKSMVMDADPEFPVDGDAELVNTLDEVMEDESMEDEHPQIMIAAPAPAKPTIEVVEKKVQFLEGCQVNKELKKKFKKDRKALKKADKVSEELLNMIPDEEGNPSEEGDEYDFGVLAQGLPMDE